MNSKGLGDSVEKVTRGVGIKSLMDFAFGKENCRCEQRKRWLNDLFPYKNSSNGRDK